METEILAALTQQLADTLNNALQKLSPNWWQIHVIDKLTFQQQNFARNLPPKALKQLDLAALLRVADQNWFELSQQANLNKDARNWLKEAMTIRNRWAHVPAGGLDENTQYRDLDTLERLLQAFGASADTCIPCSPRASREMKRFDERFEHLDGGALRYCLDETHLDGVWPQNYSRAIVPYSLFDEALLMGKQNGKKRQKGLLDLDPPPAFDLVIVDEAHHIRNTDTYAYRTVRYFCDNAEAVALMSATPIQLGSDDLYNLLHLLRPDVLPSRRDFDQMADPTPI
jgi:hypothetical protein